MEIALIILSLVVLGLLAFVVFQSKKGSEDSGSQKVFLDLLESLRREMQESAGKSREEIQGRIDRMNDVLQKGMQNSATTIQKQFTDSAQIIREVTEKLGKLDETNKQVLDFSKQLQSLENILKNPKQRGILGEYFLETLLSNILAPELYKMQYAFSDGEIVDAAVFVNDKIIPIDAKFSLEKYNLIQVEQDTKRREELVKDFKRDIKNRIDETSKYIRANENTTDFAFMFIPAEGIYYEMLIYKTGALEVNAHDLIEYAFKKKVIIVSPTSFYAYLETVLHGLRALKLEKSIQDIVKRIGELSKHMNAYEVYVQKIGQQLSTVVTTYNTSYKELGKIDKDFYKITEGDQGGAMQIVEIEKPQLGNDE